MTRPPPPTGAPADAAPGDRRRLLIVAAGTGGHVMPGLAVADALRGRGWDVSWLGTTTGMERSLVEGAGLPFNGVAFTSIRGKGAAALLRGPLRLARAVVASIGILRRFAPHAVFTTGGYIAVPAGLAASWVHRPMLFLNADAAPQLSLRILLPLRWVVRVVLCGFDGAAARLAGDRARVSGAPVRAPIAAIAPPEARFAGRAGPLVLLVAGGSLGARVLNEVLPEALALLAPDERPVVIHQCGAGHDTATRARYAQFEVAADVMPFIGDMAGQYAAADVVLCRAGAITVAELCAAGVAAVLVPLVAATTDHQRANAQFLAEHGAALHLPQAQCRPAALAALLRTLTRERLRDMAANARRLGRPDATARVVFEIESLVPAAAPGA
jgi:UDP-N-acetylglucosamine--N-acetylmuramyl-(pentapeptide) pyrophosphoryl-undecaprenol N-acetylglucosamine transferase